MRKQPVNLNSKLAVFSDHWAPRVIARLNDYEIKLAKISGEFVWHHHADTDEAFLVLKGSMVIEFRDGEVALNEGELFIVPRGVEHKPRAEAECHVLLIEPEGVVNTGESGGPLTAEKNRWV